MKLIKSDINSVSKCVDSLLNGQVVILPTDTVYGFSGIVSEGFNCEKKIQLIKGRSETKPFIQLIANPQDIFKYTNDKIPQKLLDYWPGPLTIIANDIRLQNNLIKTTAFRCPGDKWLREIICKCNAPIYSTSVNRSGNPVLETENAILDEFENEVDLIILDGDKKNALPSTIIKINENGFEVLRQGCLKIND